MLISVIQDQHIQVHIGDDFFCTGNSFFGNPDYETVSESFKQLHRFVAHGFVVAVVIGDSVTFCHPSVTSGKHTGSEMFG
ncbi:hypothetical protein SDC9_192316 [bioreactor metagenome]|uniref:Uncharacterized protein n=1 Tax=bioreactor metagenome TaxID=1076179 RepID=A0A645I0D4_9ZZZZ